MKFSYNYLKQWLDFDLTPRELADLIYLHITEVESLADSGQWAGFVVGEITAIASHPNADNLRLAKVDVGGRVLDIVCGAHNIAVGQKVPVALPGAMLPSGLEIRPTVIRGEASSGMLCSRAELGLTGDASGIMLLDPNRSPGAPLSEVLGGEGDSVLELKILANRPDYMSYLTLAREIAAVLKFDFRPDLPTDFSEQGEATAKALRVEVKSPACPRYLARVVRQVTVGASPDWMQSVLTAAGIRPINNVVDAANLVMLELGQPIHTFDYDTIAGHNLVVRLARPREPFTGLDGVAHQLDEETLVIADSRTPLAIAGVIGSEVSGVKPTTTTIAVEVANFGLVSIRNTSRRLGLRTDASARFERGLDIFLPELAMARFLHLISQVCSEAKIAPGTIDIHRSLPPAASELRVGASAVNQLLGTDIPAGEMADILTRLDLVAQVSGDELLVRVPHYRGDISTVADLAEEVVRIYGIAEVEASLPSMPIMPVATPSAWPVMKKLRELLARLGAIEIYTRPFDTSSEAAVALANPLSSDATHLKTDLAAGVMRLEIDRSEFRVFELGRVFAASREPLPTEKTELAVRIRERDAYAVARGIADMILDALGILAEWREVAGVAGLRAVVGRAVVGELTPWGAEALLTFDITTLTPLARLTKTYRELPKFPAVKMDMAFFVPDRVRLGELIKDIWTADPLVDKIELFDQFTDPDRGRSAAFHIELRSSVRTLTKADRDRVVDIIKTSLLERHKARLRDE